jgi:HEPN domain-containing protein
MNGKAEYWLALAREDMDVARVLLGGGKRLYAGFMCHLAAEKALKARLESLEIQPPKLHNLVRLAGLGEIFDAMSASQQRLLASLGPLNIEARYPQQKSAIAEALTVEACGRLIAETEEMIAWIAARL